MEDFLGIELLSTPNSRNGIEEARKNCKLSPDIGYMTCYISERNLKKISKFQPG
jgi:hypothetical protein